MIPLTSYSFDGMGRAISSAIHSFDSVNTGIELERIVDNFCSR